jgi:hypothetical protein
MLVFKSVSAQQNLVPNPSFEEYIECPTGSGQIYFAQVWSAFRGSPDYFNSCAPTSSYYSVPINAFGHQQAASGNAYVGIICFVNSVFGREIIANNLIAPLSVGQKYFITFNVSKADDSSVVGYSINKIGAKFSTVMYTNINIDNTAHIYTDSVVSDTINWTRIAGSFIADSAYEYIAIGNFFDDVNTTIVNSSSGFWAYYLVDDVCVSTDSLLCANFYNSLEETNISSQFSFFPNPATDFLTIKSSLNTPFNITVFNSLGQQLYMEQNIVSNNLQMCVSSFNEGLLFIQITSENNQCVYKLLKQ